MNSKIIIGGTIFTMMLFSVFALPDADFAEKMAYENNLTCFDRRHAVVPWRNFVLACPEKERPFSGFFLANGIKTELRLQWSDGYCSKLFMLSQDAVFKRKENRSLKPPMPASTVIFPDGRLVLSGDFPLSEIYLKPNLAKIADDVFASLEISPYQKRVPQLYHLRMEAKDFGVAFYFNGSYAGTLQRKNAYPVSLMLAARGGEKFVDLSHPEAETLGFTQINLDMKSRCGLKASLQIDKPLPVPMRANVTRAIDLRKTFATANSLYNLYRCLDLTRSAFDGLPMSCLFSVPCRQYFRAWVLCAPLPDTVDPPEFRLVATRYNELGRDEDSMSISTANLSGESKQVRKVGSTEMELNGKKTVLPLYLVEIPIDSGKIQDLLTIDPHSALSINDYLDIELQNVTRFSGIRFPRQKKKRAPVAIFALTLEHTPAEVIVRQAEFGNAFYENEQPRIPVDIMAIQSGEYELRWTVKDIEGKTLAEKHETCDLSAGLLQTTELPMHTYGIGWFSVDIAVSRKGKSPFYNFQASVTILPPDTRQAGFDSPYGTWWGTGRGHNNTASDPEQVLPFLRKAGFRFITGMDLSEEKLKKWGFTLNQIPAFGRSIFTDSRIVQDNPELWKKMEMNFKEELDLLAKRYPNCQQAVVLHESYSGQYPFRPNIMLGRQPEKFDAKREKLEKARIRAVEVQCRIIRKHYPEMKIIFGNCTWAQGILEAFMARGFDASLIDAIGSEAPGGRRLPESLASTWTTAGSAFVLRETSRLSGANKPVTGCYEWSCRTAEQGVLRQAQLTVRDILVAHAYGFQRISFGSPCDGSTAYNHDSGYGKISFANRLRQPRPLYVAAATATRNLDRVTFQRSFPLEDLSGHVFEFQQENGKWIYTIWTSRHSADFELLFDGESTEKLESEDLFGRRGVFAIKDGKCRITANESVRYLFTERRLRLVRLVRTHNPFNMAPAETPLEVHTLAAKKIKADPSREKRFDIYEKSSFTLGGMFNEPAFPVPVRIADAPDTGKGKGIRVNFDVAGLPEEPWNRAAYVKLVPEYPIIIPAQAQKIGIWIKGNKSRGRLIWEITDSMGRKYLSAGSPENGAFSLNDAYENQFSFEGWRFLAMPLTRKYAEPKDWFGYQWCGPEGRSAMSMRRPFMITGIFLSTTRNADHITGLFPVKNQELTLGTISFYK